MSDKILINIESFVNSKSVINQSINDLNIIQQELNKQTDKFLGIFEGLCKENMEFRINDIQNKRLNIYKQMLNNLYDSLELVEEEFKMKDTEISKKVK